MPEGSSIPIASLSLFRFDGFAARLWAMGQMGLSRPALARERGLTFWKLCGSGTGEGFTPKPNLGVWAILAVWPELDTAQTRVAQSPVWRAWRDKAAEGWTAFLQPLSARGAWAGQNPFVGAETAQAPPDAPLAVLTRATVKPGHALRFWGRVPQISAVIGQDPNVSFKIGIGEVPLFHQVTFSIWPDAASMAAFARGDGPHGRAIRAVREGDWFREELYARFAVIGTDGTWQGADPLSPSPQREARAA